MATASPMTYATITSDNQEPLATITYQLTIKNAFPMPPNSKIVIKYPQEIDAD